MRLVAVYDTSVLISALIYGGVPRRSLDLAREGTVDGVTCDEILSELSEKLRSRFTFAEADVQSALQDLSSFLQLTTITGALRVVTADPKDDMVIECAVAASATHIVTGDRRHLLPMGQYAGAQIVSPAQFVALALAS